MSTLCKENLYSYDKLIKLSEKNIYGRLADALLFFSTNIFSSYKFKLPLSQQEIASFVGISRESCTRTLSSFKQSGIIKLNNANVEILDINKLKDISKNG
jgi:CRP/FNR family transcriptional regulator